MQYWTSTIQKYHSHEKQRKLKTVPDQRQVRRHDNQIQCRILIRYWNRKKTLVEKLVWESKAWSLVDSIVPMLIF